jgi:hypothetical protein
LTSGNPAGASIDTRISRVDQQFYTKGSYGAFCFPFGALGETPPLSRPADYLDEFRIDPATFPANTTLNSRFPDRATTAPNLGVWAYPQLSYGNYDGGTVQTPVTPYRVGAFQALSDTFDQSFTGGNSNGLSEFYLCSASGDNAAKVLEVGWFFNPIASSTAFNQSGTQRGIFTDGAGRQWNCGQSGTFLTFSPIDGLPTNTATGFNRLAFLTWLKGLGVITGLEWINGIALGTEPIRNINTHQVNAWQVTWTPTPLPADPIQANYITSQDLTNAYWLKGGMTANTANQVTETATTEDHVVAPQGGNLTRAAGVKTFTFYVDVDKPTASYDWIYIQVFDGGFANQTQARFNIATGALGASTATGGFTLANRALTPLSNGRLRLSFDVTTDATSTNFRIYTRAYNGNDATLNGLGDASKVMRYFNWWLFNKNAGAGGT